MREKKTLRCEVFSISFFFFFTTTYSSCDNKLARYICVTVVSICLNKKYISRSEINRSTRPTFSENCKQKSIEKAWSVNWLIYGSGECDICLRVWEADGYLVYIFCFFSFFLFLWVRHSDQFSRDCVMSKKFFMPRERLILLFEENAANEPGPSIPRTKRAVANRAEKYRVCSFPRVRRKKTL